MKALIALMVLCCLLVGTAVAEDTQIEGLPALSTAVTDGCALPPKTTQFSFWSSCSGVQLDGCTLKAECRMRNGQQRAATFDMSKFPQCYSDFFGGRNLVNDNGRLCCGYAGTPVICGT